MQKGPFLESSRRTIYETAWLHVEEARVIRPGGKPGLFGLARLEPGVTVLALDDERHTFLVREYKYAIGRETIELVSGAVDPGEDPLAAAIRELHEETGFRARRARSIGIVDPLTTIVSCPVHLILAEDLVHQPRQTASEDLVEPFRVPFARALAMVEDGTITHAPSCVALLRSARMIEALR